MIQQPPVSGAPYTPLPGATYGTFNLPAWPTTFNGGVALLVAGAALAWFGPQENRYRVVAAGVAGWGGWRAYKSMWPF